MAEQLNNSTSNKAYEALFDSHVNIHLNDVTHDS